MADRAPKDYEEVHVRTQRFLAKHPEGSLVRVGDLQFETLPNKHGDMTLHVIYTAAAYRHPEDPRPGIGTACEPIPGLTPYTKGSEVENAETSAWGRALAAVGFSGKKGIATAEELNSKVGDPKKPNKPKAEEPVDLDDKGRKMLDEQLDRYVEAGGDYDQLALKAVSIGCELDVDGHDTWSRVSRQQGLVLYRFMQQEIEAGNAAAEAEYVGEKNS